MNILNLINSMEQAGIEYAVAWSHDDAALTDEALAAAAAQALPYEDEIDADDMDTLLDAFRRAVSAELRRIPDAFYAAGEAYAEKNHANDDAMTDEALRTAARAVPGFWNEQSAVERDALEEDFYTGVRAALARIAEQTPPTPPTPPAAVARMGAEASDKVRGMVERDVRFDLHEVGDTVDIRVSGGSHWGSGGGWGALHLYGGAVEVETLEEESNQFTSSRLVRFHVPHGGAVYNAAGDEVGWQDGGRLFYRDFYFRPIDPAPVDPAPAAPETTLVNLTPHALQIACADGSTVTFPPSGSVARVADTRSDRPALRVGGVEIPVSLAGYGDVTGLPAPAPGVVYVVSGLVLARCADRADVFAPGILVRDAAGNVIGAQGLSATPAY